MGAHGFSAIGMTWYTIESTDPAAYRLIGVVDADGDQRSDLVLSRVEPNKRKEDHHIFALLSTGTRFALPSENDWAIITQPHGLTATILELAMSTAMGGLI
jgi:hypothetical protein